MRGILGISVNNRVEAEDARWLLSMAGLSDLDTMVSLEGGWDNSNFHLRLLDGSEVVLKAWFANTLDEVSRVIKRHLHLDSHGIATTVPIQMLDGHYVAVKDGFAWTLLPFVKGGFLGSDEDSLRSLGETLARMHSIPDAECFPREYRMGFVLFEEVITLSTRMEGGGSFGRLLADESKHLRSIVSDVLPTGVLHGDLFPDNVIGESGRVCAILDLEEAWIGPMCFDIAMAFVGFGWEGNRPISGRWNSLIQGYQSVRRLSDEEWRVMPEMHRYATLAIACWRFWKHNLKEPDESLSRRYLEMIDRLEVEFDFSEASL